MKKCTICHTEYDLRIEYCFRDGSKLDATTISQSSQSIVHPGAISGDPVDMMQTLDNISIDDLLQIGGPGAFKGFGEFTPIQAPASKDGDTISMSRTTIRDMLEQEVKEKPVPSTVSSSVREDEVPDIEDVLGVFGNDIGAHLDDTLDGVQVGQILDDSTLDMDLSNSNEIMPGDTLDVMIDDLGMPEMSESDLQTSTDTSTDLDSWEASGPIMQEAARQAMAQHKAHTKSTSSDKPEGQAKGNTSTVGDEVKAESTSEKKSPVLLILAGVLLIGGIGFALLGGDQKSKAISVPEKSVNAQPYTPPPVEVKSEPSQDDDPEDPTKVDNEETLEDSQSTQKDGANSFNAVKKNMESEKSMATPISKDVVPKDATPKTVASPTVQELKVGSTASPNPKPVKPKTTPKPMPSKDKETNKVIQKDSSTEAEIGWGATENNASTSWGSAADNCSVTVRSNVSSAEVYIDGDKRGAAGQTIPVDCGSHRLEVRAGSYQPLSKSIEVSNASQHTMDFGR